MKPAMRRVTRVFLMLLLAGAVTLALVAAALFVALRAQPGDWAQRVDLGPLSADIGVLAAIRIVTHPLGMRALDGRSVASPIGVLHFSAGAEPDSLQIVCEPCRLEAPAISPKVLGAARAQATVLRSGANDLHGDLRVGGVAAAWRGALHARDLVLDVEIADAAARDVYALFADAIPEVARARIEGRVSGVVRVSLPAQRVVVQPLLAGFGVDGLGAQERIDALPPAACARATRRADAALPFGSWVPKAVVAAEDPRFFEHSGYELAEMTAAWTRPGGLARFRGTLSQQLARQLLGGSDQALTGRLRELLYAVELDQALGKPGLLALYLATAPWGPQRCGAEAAAQNAFGKRAALLTPLEAAWLAGVLRDPEEALRRASEGRPPDRKRLEAILAGMTPMTRPQRRALQAELPQWQPPPGATAP